MTTRLPWTVDEDRKLIELRALGKKRHEIAEALGTRTVGAVIARIGDMKQTGKAPSPRMETTRRALRRENALVRPVILDECPEGFKTLLEAKSNDCRYPQSSAHFICGKETVKGSSYCPYHLSICYQHTPKFRHKALERIDKSVVRI